MCLGVCVCVCVCLCVCVQSDVSGDQNLICQKGLLAVKINPSLASKSLPFSQVFPAVACLSCSERQRWPKNHRILKSSPQRIKARASQKCFGTGCNKAHAGPGGATSKHMTSAWTGQLPSQGRNHACYRKSCHPCDIYNLSCKRLQGLLVSETEVLATVPNPPGPGVLRFFFCGSWTSCKQRKQRKQVNH